MKKFEPKFIAFLCNWCAYAGADLAGVSRIQHPPNFRIIKVMCSGRVDPIFILHAFQKGIDGVMIGGCYLGECHYILGNYKTLNMVRMTKVILKHADIEPERLLLEWISASEGVKFARVVDKFTHQIKELGPLALDEGKKLKLKAAINTLRNEKIRVLLAKQSLPLDEGGKYGEVSTSQGVGGKLERAIMDEVKLNEVLLMLKEKPSSVEDISRRLSLSITEVLKYNSNLRRKGLIDSIEGEEGEYEVKEPSEAK